MLESTKAKLIDLLSAWLEEAENQEGEQIGAYANCAHDLNSLIKQIELLDPIEQFKELLIENKITLEYTTSDDGIHVCEDGNEVASGWMFSKETIESL